MANEARNHHYIPQCYLRGFANRNTGKHKLTVANLKGRRFFETTPRNVGSERDFNRIDVEGLKPDILESQWAIFESKISESIRHVDETGLFEGESKTVILNLAALMAVRHPSMRENMRKFEEIGAKRILDLILETKEEFESSRDQSKKINFDFEINPSYEELKSFHDNGEYTIEVSRERHIKNEFQMIETILPLLALRKWSVFRSNQKGHFITSDKPLILIWRNIENIPLAMRNSPGFGTQDTEVIFPLSKNTAIVGTFDKPEISLEVELNVIANANTKTIQNAHRQLYCHQSKFPYYGPDMKLHNDSHFFDQF